MIDAAAFTHYTGKKAARKAALVKGVQNIHTLFQQDVDLSLFEPFKIDCGKCCGLCCTGLYFTKSEGFPEDKKAGVACKNLQQDFKCRVHSTRSEQGLKGCMAYDCLGAGQQVTRRLAEKPVWQSVSSEEAKKISSSFQIVLRLHQVLWYLTQAFVLRLPDLEKEQNTLLLKEGWVIAQQTLERLQSMNIEPFYEKANKFLKHICSMITDVFFPRAGKPKQSKNYMGKSMRQKDLTGKDFSMALLIAADLEQSTLYGVNFLGADLRDTNICNTDLSRSLFMTQMQVNTAKGNGHTVLPPYLNKPVSWKK